ncbi:MAG TPA: hypothetical protein VNQ73_16640 [Ilumatobacter sp.]|nr:hypothetical protein [Ilumatobacter sp.]
MPEPIPPDRLTRLYDELLSIAAQMAAEHDAIFKVITDSHGPWTILKHDLNRLTAMFGAGLASTVTSDPAILRANVDRRLNQLVNADDEGTPSGPEMATTGTESESNGLAGQRRRGMVL